MTSKSRALWEWARNRAAAKPGQSVFIVTPTEMFDLKCVRNFTDSPTPTEDTRNKVPTDFDVRGAGIDVEGNARRGGHMKIEDRLEADHAAR